MIDDMRPRERKRAFLEGRDIDRLPGWYFPENYCGNLTGITMREYYLDPAKQIEAILATHTRWELDTVQTMFNIGLDLGTEMEFPENGYAVTSKTIDPTEKEIESWALDDPRTNPAPAVRTSWYILNELIDKLGETEKAEISVMVPGPFTMASSTIGTERFLKKLIRDPDYVHLLVGKLTDLIIEGVQALRGYDVIFWTGDPIASGSMIKPDQYRTFAKPYMTRIVNALKDVVPQNEHMLHMCGNTTKIWEDMADTGTQMINIDETIDFADARRRVGDRTRLVGHVAPMTMLIGSEEDVINDLKASIKDAWGAKRMLIPGFGDAPPMASPIKNFDALFAAHRKYAKWPVDPTGWDSKAPYQQKVTER
ncbi:MAG: uroporphyrinogen decarboxylase family protein [Clostridiales Family XIII bacterium]|jgi:uroporphyrinogen decarboxylase|nr:uroporphyrinogen decarboxylase family protein [Clostridiales Family XIII bacterium]